MSRVWEQNLKAIQESDPQLAEWLDSLPGPTEKFRLGRAADGSPLLGVRHPDGQYAALGHSQNPRADAEAWVRQLSPEIKANGNLLLLGFGSGYHPQALFEQSSSDTWLWIAEPDAALFRSALHLRDFSSLLRSSRVRFLVGKTEAQTAQAMFEGAGSYRTLAQGIRLVFPPMSRYYYGEYLSSLANVIEEKIRFQGLVFKTSELQGEKITANVLANLPWVIHGQRVLSLLSRFAGFPALVVAPGPSLQEALPLLKQHRNRFLLIAVDTANRILQKNGLQADWVVSLDFTELNSQHFDGIENDAAWLVAFPGVDPRIPAKYPGRTFFFDHAGTSDYSGGATPLLKAFTALPPLGDLISYGSTAHSAYHLARMMGCAPILLVGNDLALSGEQQYAAGAMQTELARSEPMTDPFFEVPANDGGIAKTIPLYKYYLDTFRVLIEGLGGDVFNTSLHGAAIDGVRYFPLEEVLSLFPPNLKGLPKINEIEETGCGERIPEIEADRDYLANECRGARKDVQILRHRLESLSPQSTDFRAQMIQWMKALTEFLHRRDRAVQIAIPLCSRKTVAFAGQLGDAGLFGGGNVEQNRQAWERCLDFMDELMGVFKAMADRLALVSMRHPAL